MTYRPMGRLGRLLPLVFVIFAVAAVGIVVAIVRGKGPPIAFAVFWLAAVGWNAYWWLFRTCIEVRVDGASLEWRAPLWPGSAALTDVRRIRKSRISRQLAVIELQGRRPLLVPVRYGFSQLEAAISGGAPLAVIDPV
jgi:hypothetical protein